ncbi:MAG: UDP-N-acetylglucosamine 1-carboxyvinyltransferase [Clostridia bacterium]|jgi:UDP-N-acetylglucosamine 1-carboxyvinyltransferase|nr:UDP-N-acetylglucosamine 1-carboxyvinyltransferase [Clostridia bacterium]
MSHFVIRGGKPLDGAVSVSGAKNSVLPILAATLLSGGRSTLHNCPDLRDVRSALDILRHLGCKAERQGSTVTVDSSAVTRCDVPIRLMREMRSSVIFLGPIIARCGKARLSFPGGCELGPRPIDLHLSALKKLGVDIREEGGEILCTAGDMRGQDILLSFPSVGATENIMLAATACRGVTRIINAAREPEIADLQQYLQKCGVTVSGAGESRITVAGGGARNDVVHTILPDRIEAATYLCAAAVTGGKVTLHNTEPEHFGTVTALLSEAGCSISACGGSMTLQAPQTLGPMSPVRTMPYPGFATDAQAPLMAVACLTRGTTVFLETIFENRYRHTAELARMGADIRVSGRVALVTGVPELRGAPVCCTDLRGGAALVLAALAARGETVVEDIYHIDRGYTAMETRLAALGADIRRVEA